MNHGGQNESFYVRLGVSAVYQRRIEKTLKQKQQLRDSIEEIEQAKTEADESTQRAKQALAETERFNRLMLGREMRVIEMKREVNALLAELGREPQYQSVLENETVVLSDKAE